MSMIESKVVRVHQDALKVARSYNEDLSTAILLMEERIKTLEKDRIDRKVLVKVVTGAVSDALIDVRKGY